ncbi:protein transport protein SEC39 [Geosmithia morbida]|uniref:Protein transport protein SEC39 n=1 Tax=Geosmithia morbida TaxID=1094350 RepID=A0A9P5D2S4_9HYPO|nr:protein transport protein SEC39 [Geosmithia morbida]KAF4121771.1 protein transport protein SEC39 [Geosmithia morbida]
MSLSLPPSKAVLLAAHYASRADIAALQHLVSQHRSVLSTELVLRILLTYLPETTPPHSYTDFLQQLASGNVSADEQPEYSLDTSAVEDITDAQASKRARKLHLLKLSQSVSLTSDTEDLFVLFLHSRALRMDEEAGMLNHVADLLLPFVDYAPSIKIWMASTFLPLSRRNSEYYTQGSHSLASFEGLSDRSAVQYLLSQTGLSEDRYDSIGRDLRGLLSPWLYNSARWLEEGTGEPGFKCAGWEQVLEWLTLQASRSWPVAVQAIIQWNGPRDVDFEDEARLELEEDKLHYLDQTYTKAALASVYSLSESTMESLEGAYAIVRKARFILGLPSSSSAQEEAEDLPNLSEAGIRNLKATQLAPSFLRNNLLQPNNPFTEPTPQAVDFLTGLVLSAFILTKLGIPCSVKKAGDLALLGDKRDQKSQLVRLVRFACNQALSQGDDYWIRIRRDVLWLHHWGVHADSIQSHSAGKGVFGAVPEHDIEVELLKAILSQSRYFLAQSLYEDVTDLPLPDESVQDAVYHAALDAFDHASNPNRTKGGLRKCNDIMHALPRMVPRTLPAVKRIESLMSAAHSLSGYRLVLKKGEPFRPVVLRVHSDPISIIDKVLEQNAGAYTRLQEFLEIGMNMIIAGFFNDDKKQLGVSPDPQKQDAAMEQAEKRIVAACIFAALREDDFETAYSYVASRLGDLDQTADEWSWKAALKAGEYIRTSNTRQPTHLGTSSANPEIRHLEQRLDCLATALRVAPASQLQPILEVFRRCEEQLDSAIADEAEREAAWDTAGDMQNLPGSYDMPTSTKAYPSRNKPVSAAARQAEEAPMSLFDLSRATARIAQRNLTSLSSLKGLAHGSTQSKTLEPLGQEREERVRRRDQFREAATGTLVSGVGWLIGANVSRNDGAESG